LQFTLNDCGRDFGWISLVETIERLERTLTTVEKMQRHRGHLYNWYDTRTLTVMHPAYISTVDSGNMAGHLISVSSALKSWSAAPAVYLMGDTRGIGDVAAIVRQASVWSLMIDGPFIRFAAACLSVWRALRKPTRSLLPNRNWHRCAP
jgi:hypothetical protein